MPRTSRPAGPRRHWPTASGSCSRGSPSTPSSFQPPSMFTETHTSRKETQIPMSSDEQRTKFDRALAKVFREQLTRRRFLRQAGRGGIYAGGALSLPAILAACGIGPSGSPSAGASGAAATPTPSPVGGGEPSGTLIFANWELYIDPGPNDDPTRSPTLAALRDEFGIETTYTENI